VVEEEGLVCVGMEEEGLERERERVREAAVEREKEKVISSEIIPTVPKMMAYQVLCGVWKRKGQERERERERGSGGWRSSVAED
jgi:hypothetical protein